MIFREKDLSEDRNGTYDVQIRLRLELPGLLASRELSVVRSFCVQFTLWKWTFAYHGI